MYSKTVADLRRRISSRYKGLRPKSFGGNASNNISEKERMQYLLWMCCRVLEFDDPIKATSWIGWMSREAEALGLIDNQATRAIRRRDIEAVHLQAKRFFA